MSIPEINFLDHSNSCPSNYMIFSNSEGKKWTILCDNVKTNLCIYQPSSIKGKLLKKLIPILCTDKLLFSLLPIKHCYCTLNSNISSIIANVFNEDDLSYSFFHGTPGVHQKVIIQISKGNCILGYCKLTDSNSVYQNFLKEMNILLSLCKYRNVPRGLCVTRIMDDSAGIFIQSTSKTANSRTCHRLNDCHFKFIFNLCKDTLRRMEYKNSQIYKDIVFLRNFFHGSEDKTISFAINELANGPQLFCYYHGDFTPWNTYVERNELYVFDWEYAETDYIPMLDLFHFFTQVCYFQRHMSSNKVFKLFSHIKTKFDGWVKWTGYRTEVLYLIYLLSMISKTIQREPALTDTSKKSIDFWRSLINEFRL